MGRLDRISGIASGRRSKWVVVAIWVVLAVALGSLQPRLQESTTNEPEEFLPESAQSTQAIELLEQFPSGRETPALLVFRREVGLTRADRARIARDVTELTRSGAVESSGRPVVPFTPAGGVRPGLARQGLVSEDGSTALAIVPLTEQTSEGIQDDVEVLRDRVHAIPGVEAHVTGPAGLSTDAIEVFQSIDVTLLLVTASLVLVLLLLIYRSPVVALVPLVVVGIAYGIAAGIVYALVETGAIQVNGQTTGLLIVLMFGAGTDYCLLIVARYREELRRHEDRHRAMAAASRRTAPAILSAGGTVVAAMLVLLAADLKSTAGLGPTLAIGVAVMIVAGLTLLPALLALLGRGAFWPSVPHVGAQARRPLDVWRRIGNLVHDRPVTTIVVVLVVLGAGALGNLTDAPSLGFGAGFRDETDGTAGQQIVDEHLDPGLAGSANVVAATPAAATVGRALAREPIVASVRPAGRSDDGSLTRIDLTLTVDPYSQEAKDAIPELRAAAAEAAGGATVAIGGPTAQNHDSEETLASDARIIVPAIFGVIFLILVALLRALVAPLYLVLTVVVSFAFALGTSRLIFVELIGMDAIEPSLPTIAFIFLVALGIDYNIFLISRVREESSKLGSREGVISGLERTGGVITSAGLILAGTFAALMALPLDSLFQVGFTIAFGILVDTFVVRSFLVPAIAFKLGRLNWWPGALARSIGERGSVGAGEHPGEARP